MHVINPAAGVGLGTRTVWRQETYSVKEISHISGHGENGEHVSNFSIEPKTDEVRRCCPGYVDRFAETGTEMQQDKSNLG